MKRGIVIALVLLLALSFIVVKYEPDFKIDSSKINAKVVDEVQQNNNARVTIKLKTDELADGKRVASEETKKEVQDILKDKIKHEFNDKISAVVSKEDLEKLKDNPDVELVEIVRTRSIVLQDSVPLIEADDVWDLQSNNVSLTGEGEAICIIDTGINYNHNDLGGGFGEGYKVIGGYDYCADDNNCTTSDEDPMDVHGHGTHVAGIAAANGDIKGVAPGANVFMIKAANSDGTFWDDDLEKAIDLCVNNASQYNISVISMSLGGGLYSNYCEEDPLADEIDNAAANNITVVVATGNNGRSNKISGPSCVESAIPIAGSTKDNSIYSDGNRNSLVKLLAPGKNINSTAGTGYNVLSGTSMSAPHAAGAFAIINQYLGLSGELKTPAEIETLLSDNGFEIEDSGNTYDIINLYEAVASLDNSAPEITLVSPEDNANNNSVNQTFVCQASDFLGIENMTLYVWNSTGNIISETNFVNISGNSSVKDYTVEVNLTNLSRDVYEWNCLGEDIKGNSGYAEENFTLVSGSRSITLNSPEDGIYKSVNETEFNCSVVNNIANIEDMALYIYSTTEVNGTNVTSIIYNETKNVSGSFNESIFNYNFSDAGEYEWTCSSTDEELNTIFANNYSLIYDSSSPSVTLVSPENGVKLEDDSSSFSYNASDNYEVSSCNLTLDDVVIDTDSSVSEGENTFSSVSLEDDTSYSWEVECVDISGNYEVSSSRSLEVDLPSEDSEDDEETDTDTETDTETDTDSDTGTDSGTGGGGGGDSSPTGAVTYVITDNDFEKGISKPLGKDSKMRFKFQEEFHALNLDSISTEEIKVTVSSDPINLTISKGDTEKVDLNDDKVYDVAITFESITAANADVKIKKIEEAIGTREIVNETDDEDGSDSKTSGITGKGILEIIPLDFENKTVLVSFVASVLLFTILVVLCIRKRKVIAKKISGIRHKKESQKDL